MKELDLFSQWVNKVGDSYITEFVEHEKEKKQEPESSPENHNVDKVTRDDYRTDGLTRSAMNAYPHLDKEHAVDLYLGRLVNTFKKTDEFLQKRETENNHLDDLQTRTIDAQQKKIKDLESSSLAHHNEIAGLKKHIIALGAKAKNNDQYKMAAESRVPDSYMNEIDNLAERILGDKYGRFLE